MTTLHYACSTGTLGVAQWIAEVAPELATALSDVRACVVVGGVVALVAAMLLLSLLLVAVWTWWC